MKTRVCLQYFVNGCGQMHDNFIVMGDFNIDANLTSHEHDKLKEFYLFNLIDSKIDLILTSNSNSFQKLGTTETGFKPDPHLP